MRSFTEHILSVCHDYTNFNYMYNVVSVLCQISHSHIVNIDSHALLDRRESFHF
jgi:hypothetical protein